MRAVQRLAFQSHRRRFDTVQSRVKTVRLSGSRLDKYHDEKIIQKNSDPTAEKITNRLAH
jgi:hypothetical protein